MKEIIGRFTVIDEEGLRSRAIVGQEKEIDEGHLIIASKKSYRLHDLEGEEIMPTDTPNIFLRRDGSLLKKVGVIRNS